MSNRRGGEARESGDGVWHLAPADGTQGEVVIKGERAVTDENKSAGSKRGVERRRPDCGKDLVEVDIAQHTA